MKQASEHIPDWATDIYLDLPLMESVANTITRNSDGSWHDAEEVACMQAQLVAEHLYGKDDDIDDTYEKICDDLYNINATISAVYFAQKIVPNTKSMKVINEQLGKIIKRIRSLNENKE